MVCGCPWAGSGPQEDCEAEEVPLLWERQEWRPREGWRVEHVNTETAQVMAGGAAGQSHEHLPRSLDSFWGLREGSMGRF